MILKSLTVQGMGPFVFPIELQVDSEVTVLTGRNDVGKSKLLRVIECLCQNQSLKEEEVSLEMTRNAPHAWRENRDIRCDATFVVTDRYSQYITNLNLQPGDEIQIRTSLAFRADDNRWQIRSVRRNGTQVNSGNGKIIKLPEVLLFTPQQEEIRSTINPQKMNANEKKFLALAFGPNGLNNFYITTNPALRQRRLKEVEKSLNKRLMKLLPPSMSLQLDISLRENPSLEFFLNLADKFNGHTTLDLRGAGVRRILTLMAYLLERELTNEHFYLLLDEPENSLHADSQHMLRRLLEELAK
ncbi:MAG: AAA family ATPase [Candidatus Binatia bacterium]